MNEETNRASAQPLARYGWRCLQIGDPLSAVLALGAAVERAPERPEVWRAYGLALAQVEKIDDACTALMRSLALDAEPIDVWCVLAELRLRQADYRGAAEALRQCVARDPGARTRSGTRARLLAMQAQRALEGYP